MQKIAAKKIILKATGNALTPQKLSLSCLVLHFAAFIVFIGIVTGSIVNDAHGSECLTRYADRTFVQFLRMDAKRSDAQWDSWFTNIDTLGFSEIIVQWSSFKTVNFYFNPAPGEESSDTLAAFIRAAGRHNKKVWIGLHYDPRFWEKISKENGGPVSYFKERLEQMDRGLPFLLDALETADPSGKIINGWYISDEIDDRNWRTPARRNTLWRYLKSLRRMLSKANPAWPTLISGFSNGDIPPVQWAAFWKDLLTQTGIDGFLFQDGIGAGKLTFEASVSYQRALLDAFDGAESIFGVIVELFQTIIRDDGLRADMQAADMKRVSGQLDLARAYSRIPITVFSAPDYLTMESDASRKALYLAWLKDRALCE